jgi:hypothetical protein
LRIFSIFTPCYSEGMDVNLSASSFHDEHRKCTNATSWRTNRPALR